MKHPMIYAKSFSQSCIRGRRNREVGRLNYPIPAFAVFSCPLRLLQSVHHLSPRISQNAGTLAYADNTYAWKSKQKQAFVWYFTRLIVSLAYAEDTCARQ